MLTANGHYILVKQNELVTTTGMETLDASGFELQHEDKAVAEAAVQLGVVVSIGPTAWECFGPNFEGKPWAKVGDTVFFPRYSGAVVNDPETNEEFVLINDKDVQVTITDGANPEFKVKEYEFTPNRES